MVRFAADSLCHTVVKACREPHLHVASTLTRNRRLFTHGWTRNAGRSGRTRCRRRRPTPLVLVKPQGEVRYRELAAGGLHVRHRGVLPVVFSRQGAARKVLGLVTDAPALAAAGLIQADDRRGEIAPGLKDTTPLLGLGPYQNRSYRAAGIHRPRVCFAYALLTPRRIARDGAPGQRPRKKAADVSTATAQDQLRSLRWEDLIAYLQEERHGPPGLEDLERRRVA
jgi:hypothetical protein